MSPTLQGPFFAGRFCVPLFGSPSWPLKWYRRFWITPPAAKVVPAAHPPSMGLDKVERARRRALRAGPYPKPRGRAPRGSNGLPQVWDKERGGWSDADPQPAWAWSSTLQLPELDAATTAINTAAAEAVAAATRVAWEAPIFGSSTRASSRRASPVAGHGCTSACSSRHVAAACTPSSTFHRVG